MKATKLAAALGLATIATPVLAETAPVTATSPDGSVRVALTSDGEGRAASSVRAFPWKGASWHSPTCSMP